MATCSSLPVLPHVNHLETPWPSPGPFHTWPSMPGVVWLPPCTLPAKEMRGMGLSQERKMFCSFPSCYFCHSFNLDLWEFVEWGCHPGEVSESQLMGREGPCFHQGSLHIESFSQAHLSSWGAVWCHRHRCLLSKLVVSSALDLHSIVPF